MDPNATTIQEAPHNNHKVLAVVIVAIVLLGFLFLISYLGRGKTAKYPGPSSVSQTGVSPTAASKYKGTLSATSRSSTAKVGESVVMTVTASSDSQPVSGYDIVITYNPAVLTFASAKSTQNDFSLLGVQKSEGKVTLIGSKKLSSTQSVVLSNTSLAELTFTAKSAGKGSVALQFSPGSSTDTNLWNGDSKPQDVLGSAISTVMVTVQ